MHILLVPSEYPTPDHKLGGIFTYEQEKFLSKKNKLGVIYIYLFSINKIFSSLLVKCMRLQKINKKKYIFYFPRLPFFKLINYQVHYLFFLFAFKKYIKINGIPDLLHVHFTEFSIVTAYKIKKKYNIPYILTEHSTDFLDGKHEKSYKKGSVIYKKIFLALKNSKKIICVSSYLKKKIKKYYNLKDEKFKIIANLSLDIGLKFKKNNDIIFVGTLEKRKNPFLLLKAFKKIYKKKINMKIVGDGPLKIDIERYIKKNNLSKHVKLFSNLERKSVLKMIGSSKVLVLPSYYETFGVVIIEAFSMGVPVVMTDSYGVRDLNNINCSIMVKNNKLNTLAQAIEKVLKNTRKYDSNKIRNFYKKNFSSKIIINRIQKLYRF